MHIAARCRELAPRAWLWSLIAGALRRVGVAGGSKTQAPWPRSMAADLLVERLPDQLGHGRAPFSRHLTQPLHEVFGRDDRGATHSIIMADIP
jgi:hypothetical protein